MGSFIFSANPMTNLVIWFMLSAFAVVFSFGTPQLFASKENTEKIIELEDTIKESKTIVVDLNNVEKDVEVLQLNSKSISDEQKNIKLSIQSVKDGMVTKEDFKEFKEDIKLILRNE